MKKNLFAFSAIAAALLTFSACQKNAADLPTNPNAQVPSEEERYMPNTKGIIREFNFQLPLTDNAQKITTEVKDNLVIMEGDIILGNLVEFEGSEAVAIDGASYRWTSSVIPY